MHLTPVRMAVDINLEKRLNAAASELEARLTPALRWCEEQVSADPRARILAAFAGGMIVGKVVNRAGH